MFARLKTVADAWAAGVLRLNMRNEAIRLALATYDEELQRKEDAVTYESTKTSRGQALAAWAVSDKVAQVFLAGMENIVRADPGIDSRTLMAVVTTGALDGVARAVAKAYTARQTITEAEAAHLARSYMCEIIDSITLQMQQHAKQERGR